MVNWRELGEVPDSEDDDAFDSQPRLAQELPPTQPGPPTTTEKTDVWDVPSSQEDELAQAPVANQFRPSNRPSPSPKETDDPLDTDSPLSSLNSSQDLPPIDDLGRSQSRPDTPQGQPELPTHERSQTPVDEAPKTYIDIASPEANQHALEDVAQAPTLQKDREPHFPLASQILGHDVEHEEARRAAVSYERSLRRRRPEQLRPYFTEQARFNIEWRQHGLRPVRISNGDEEPRRRSESPDENFEPESQGTIAQRISDESQLIDPNGPLGIVEGQGDSSSPSKTSPLNHRGGPSSQMSSQADTDNTSVVWDDLPPIEDLASMPKPQSAMRQTLKRHGSLTYSSKSKRRRREGAGGSIPYTGSATRFIRPPDSSDPVYPPDHLPDRQASPSPFSQPNPFLSPIKDKGKLTRESLLSPFPQKAATPAWSDSDSDQGAPLGNVQEDGGIISSDASSESDAEIVHQNSRRIKGVLPASWLRLDQQYGRTKIQKKMDPRQKNMSPERENRRGLAQRRFGSAAVRGNDLVFDESEDDTRPTQKTTDEVFHNQTTIPVETAPVPPQSYELSSDDGSVIEEDTIDQMLSGKKRQLKLSDSFRQAPKRSKQDSLRKTGSAKLPRQPKITTALGQSTGSSARKTQSMGKVRKPKSRRQLKQQGATKNRNSRPRKVPHLSILDVIQPDAPRFLKIAARTAKQKSNQGRSSPGKKTIQLAARADHVDALSVLDGWRAGSIPQRQSVSAARKPRQPRPRAEPLTERPANSQHQPQSRPRQEFISMGGSRKLAGQLTNGGDVSYRPQAGSKPTHKTLQATTIGEENRQRPVKGRPAQLEIDDGQESNRFAFHSGKKFLDRLYRNKYGDTSVASSIFSAHVSEMQLSDGWRTDTRHQEGRDGDTTPSRPLARPRRRKPKPRQIDVDAPQYSHAHDPLPTTWSPIQELEEPRAAIRDTKLLGLGPYGTTYTQHFEVFPLEQGVYFHESTFIGSGALEAALNWRFAPETNETKPSMSFVLEEKTLYWGSWNAQVSSEFGIALDYTFEQLDRLSSSNLSQSDSHLNTANHLLTYVMERLSFDEDGDARLFIARLADALPHFNRRVKARVEASSGREDALLKAILKVYDRLVLVVFLALKVCRDDPSMTTELFQVEDLLKSVARISISTLYRDGLGLKQLRDLYKQLNIAQFRERGLRDDAVATRSWVVVMKVLDLADIPRGQFWDVAQEVLPKITSSNEAHELEQIWEGLFTVLPLTEFNTAGILVPGQRHSVARDGWGIPLKMLRRVFELYRQDSRQSPSFNNYCRALLGRCHYLVEEWGWHKSSSIVGVIFDFFGSQNLAHLRNEEFYDSPRFLEELARQPRLAIEPEDRCFHIFLKLVAVSIHKLTDTLSYKDIRNMVARTVPNHSRQFLKEQNIHERDLAALRNHHDLLCTLYWAAPADLRPSIGLIERLVVPASSHKEACLINFRAWSQLARFVVASGEATTSFKQFSLWRKSFFQQMMQSFGSVASDIRQQFLGLSTDISKSISTDMVNAMVSMNKSAIMDVLHFVVTASLDVMRHAPDLEAAMFCLNSLQLQQIFKQFASHQPELHWTMLRESLTTLDVFLSRVDEFKDDEESQQSESQILNSAQADDALLVLSHDVADSYFAMVRSVLSGYVEKDLSLLATVERATCVEQVVVLTARLVVRFTNAGVMKLSDVFGRTKYAVFQDVPHKLSIDKRRYLTLFITKVLQYGLGTFDAASCTLPDLWALAIVKPRQALSYEDKLAEQLIRHGKKFLPEAAAVGLALTPGYKTNRDLFEFAISSMRKDVREAGPSLKKILLAEHAKTLKLVMEQTKTDLRTVVENDVTEHPSYVAFVRDIIALIRAHGSEICGVEDFFYQINKEYSPSQQDPQLLVAGMMSYGLGLAEGDARANQQLFFFLYNNFKLSVNANKLGEEVLFLRKGMTNPAIFRFVLGKLIPAIVQAVTTEPSAFPLLDVYVRALYLMLGAGVAPKQLTEEHCPLILGALRYVAQGMARMCETQRRLSGEEVHVTRQLFALMSMLWPSLYAMFINSNGTATSSALGDIKALLMYYKTFTKSRETYLADMMEMGITQLDANFFLGVTRRDYADVAGLGEQRQKDLHVTSFAENIVADVGKNWVVTGARLCIQVPGKGRSSTQSTAAPTQAEQGVERQSWDVGSLEDLHSCVREWNDWWTRVFGHEEEEREMRMSRRRKKKQVDDENARIGEASRMFLPLF